MAAERGHIKAQNYLGSIYYLGRGVPQDYVESVKWTRMAADQGDIDGIKSLASAYKLGQGVPEDENKWLQLLSIAAQKGDKVSQMKLYEYKRRINERAKRTNY